MLVKGPHTSQHIAMPRYQQDRLWLQTIHAFHCRYVIISAMASQITSFSIVCPAVCSAVDQRKQSSTSLAFVVTGEFPSQRASNAENDYIWWPHHGRFLWLNDFIPASTGYELFKIVVKYRQFSAQVNASWTALNILLDLAKFWH